MFGLFPVSPFPNIIVLKRVFCLNKTPLPKHSFRKISSCIKIASIVEGAPPHKQRSSLLNKKIKSASFAFNADCFQLNTRLRLFKTHAAKILKMICSTLHFHLIDFDLNYN